MYLNVICLRCGRTIPFQSIVPYSVDKVSEGWNLLEDETNGQIISVRGAEIASICSQTVQKAKASSNPSDEEKAVKSRPAGREGEKPL